MRRLFTDHAARAATQARVAAKACAAPERPGTGMRCAQNHPGTGLRCAQNLTGMRFAQKGAAR